MATITIYPNGDGSKGSGWSNAAAGTTNLYQSIDEGTDSPNDADYVAGNTGNSTIFFLFGDTPVDFDTLTSYSLKLRLNHTSTKGDFQYLISCQLFKADESTTIASSHAVSSTTTITTYTFSATPSFTDKTSWDGVRLKLTMANAGGGGSARIYASQLDLTYTTAGAGHTFSYTGQTSGGGLTLGGVSSNVFKLRYSPSTGVVLGGVSNVSLNNRYFPSTGVVLGGSSVASFQVRYSPSTGVVLGGVSNVRIRGSFSSVGGLILNGSSVHYYYGNSDGSSEDLNPLDNEYIKPHPLYLRHNAIHALKSYKFARYNLDRINSLDRLKKQ